MVVKLADVKTMKPLRIANEYLGDANALNEMWEADGYLYLREVFDPAAMAKLGDAYLEALINMGVVDHGAKEPVWNGTSLEGFPMKIAALDQGRVWERFAAEPSVKAVAKTVFGSEAYFLPMTEYRVTPPATPKNQDTNVLVFCHQDATNNPGIPFRVFWIPIWDVKADAGGLAIAAGWHKRGPLHDPNDHPAYAVKKGIIPDSDWCRADYRRGDLLVFSVLTPHSGMLNSSDAFRCSMDLRVMRASDQRPIIGEVTEVARDAVTIRDGAGVSTRLRIDARSVVRGKNRMVLSSLAAIDSEVPIGMRVVVGHQSGTVTVLRDER